ncbi:Pre-mRNA-splicing factor ISY1-like protein [Diplonema papillatum]|nr:Pre-mRNA-splicing factor ISY1-like protein [Diplonema papillatum]
MAREKKKGQDIVSQYLRLQQGDAKRQKTDRRPFLATECKDLGECERYRLQIISEIVQKVKEIQNAALGEFRIRELNDEINKLVREKGHWQRQIKTLGGPDHFLAEPGVPDGQRPKGSGGYAYFGAAKNLPGVRELFEVETQGPVKRYARKKALFFFFFFETLTLQAGK